MLIGKILDAGSTATTLALTMNLERFYADLTSNGEFSTPEMEHLNDGKLIIAVKMMRDRTGMGLAETVTKCREYMRLRGIKQK